MPIDLDLSYLGLTIDDRDPQRIVDDALSYAKTVLPDWQPRNGSPEVVLMEALALGVSDLIYAVNRMPQTVVQAILALYDVPRSAGTPAAGSVLLTFDDVRTITIEAGMRLSIPADGSVLVVSADTTATDATTLSVPVVTSDAGATHNSIAAGTALDVLDLIPYVISAEIETPLSGGVDPETDLTYIDRASTVLARVSSSLVIADHFTAYALGDTRVGRATTIDLFDPNSGPAGADLGHVTVVLYGRSAQLDASILESLRAAMQARCAAMLTVHVEQPMIVDQDVTLTVHALSGYNTETVRANVTAAINAWMNPDVWPWGDTIRPNDIITLASGVTGVDYVDGVAEPAAAVTLASDELAQAAAITVTVL